MQGGKNLGADGLPTEFYSQYIELLVPRLTGLFTEFATLESLPGSMKEAIIVLVPKLGKDSQKCASYRPLSLLNIDAKVLAKILAICLSPIISDLIQIHQTGFMPGGHRHEY